MGLAETLGARAARKGRSAPVACGELGTVTVEALPVRELELLLRQADGQRAVFYAACRELQSAGETLRKAGQIFKPDEVMQFVSDGEAAAAARTVLELSGVTQDEDEADVPKSSVKSEVTERPDRTDEKTAENRLETVHETVQQIPEIRPATVQENEPVVQLTEESRLESVQETGAVAPGFGQVSRETEPESAEFDTISKSDKKAQAMVTFPSERTQNVVTEKTALPTGDGFDRAPGDTLHEIKSESGGSLHEIKSEFRNETTETMHEITSEVQGGDRESLHETTSEFPDGLHETKSDFDEIRRGTLHETKSEFGDAVHEAASESDGAVHEMTSDFREGLHEMTSEFTKKDRDAVHETTSELADAVARRLVEGLRRAKWVRGD